jgi:putative ABC transport system permease protein
MLRGRIIAVAGEPLPLDGDEDGRRQRETNFTWAREIPDGNELIEGDWWSGDGAAEVSVEAEFAAGLGMQLGDTVLVRIGAAELEVRVRSLRTLDWESFKPNFFMVFPPGLLESYPVTYMTSFRLEPERKSFLNSLLREHPTATVIEVDAIMAQLRSTLAQVTVAIELVLALVLIAGLLVLLAGVQSTSDMRLRESGLLRALGAGRTHILGGVAIEFLALGAMASVLAIMGAEIAFWALQRWVFELDYAPTPKLWLPALLASSALIAALGIAACRRVVNVAPTTVLRSL